MALSTSGVYANIYGYIYLWLLSRKTLKRLSSFTNCDNTQMKQQFAWIITPLSHFTLLHFTSHTLLYLH
jgi:hypothetical protein